MALKMTTKKVMAPIATGEYTAVFKSMKDGKTPADTILTFEIIDSHRLVNVYLNNARVCYESPEGIKYTSEDFFFIGLQQQLGIYDEVNPLEVLSVATEEPVRLWVISGEFTNVYSSKPKAYESAELGIC